MIKQIIYTVLVMFLLILEGMLTTLIQLPDHFQFVPYFVFTLLMLLAFRYTNTWLLTLIIICSICYDVLYAPYYCIFLVMFLIIYIFIVQIKKVFFVNAIVEFIVVLLGITLIDMILYVINNFISTSNYLLLEYVSHRLGLSLLINALVMMVLYLIIKLIEHIKWRKSKNNISIGRITTIKRSAVKRLK